MTSLDVCLPTRGTLTHLLARVIGSIWLLPHA